MRPPDYDRAIVQICALGLLVLFLILMLVTPAKAHNVPWVQTNRAVFRHCYNPGDFTAFNRVNPALLGILCVLIQDPIQNWEYVHHSDWRPERSYHHSAAAIDFRLDSYKGKGRCARLRSHNRQWDALKEHLHNAGLLDKSGIGRYPFSLNPFIHWDLRGTKARWVRVNGKYVAWEVGLTAIDKAILECESAPFPNISPKMYH